MPRIDITGVVGCKSHYLDSGSFSLKTVAIKYHQSTGKGPFAYYDTNEFWDYVNAYCNFVKKYRIAIDLFSNVDVIPNPELTWKVQTFIEREHGIRPVPVIHYPSDLKWFHRYMDAGHKIIAVGGLMGKSKRVGPRIWLDRVFEIVCPSPHYLPIVKVHGFAMTNLTMMTAYPFWSVDSSSWTQFARYGWLLVPKKRGGKFIFNEEPFVVRISHEAVRSHVKNGKHFLAMSPGEQKIVKEWLEVIDVPLGETHDGDVKQWGVTTRHSERRIANILFFDHMQRNLPKWPWAWKSTKRGGGLGLSC